MKASNRGMFYRRCLYKNPYDESLINKEGVFSQLWELENTDKIGINHGFGILQDLFVETEGIGILSGRKCLHRITLKDRMIVATIVQWLGSNVGWEFLNRCVKQCGYKIVREDQHKGTM